MKANSMTISSVRLGLIGSGAIGEQHADAARQVASVSLSAVYDPVSERATRVAKAYEAEVAGSAHAIFARNDIEAVVIATPTDTHHQLTLMAANAGKHILLEKPAGLTLAELDEMQQVCREAGVMLLVGQSLRFDHIARSLHEAVEEGDLGQLALFHWVSNIARPWPGGWGGWQADRARSGGMAVHLGIHSIDLAIWLTGSQPARVYAQGMNLAAPALDVNDYLHMNVRFENGMNALLEIHSSLRGAGNRYQEVFMLGTQGQAQWRLSDDRLLLADGGARFTGADASESMRLQMIHFAACCQGLDTPLVTPDQARWSLATALAANRSLTTNQVVEIRDEQS